MLENALQKFIDKVLILITGEATSTKGLLVKKHTENLQTHGDLSFPNTVKSWHEFINVCGISNDSEATLFQCIGKKAPDFIKESKHWDLQVKKVSEANARVYMFLERPRAIHIGLLEALSNNAFILQRIHTGTHLINVDPLCEVEKCLTSLRVKYLSLAIKNLYALTTDCIEKSVNIIFVSSKSSSKCNNRMVLCGAVLNAKTGTKEVGISACEFIRIRQDEMTLIAQHKYGVRVSTESKWKDFIAHLGESAVIFELLQTRPSSGVKINFDCSSAGSSKGAAFILYNCARLETIIRSYNERVNEGTYPPLPDFETTDFTLLTHEDEWCLVYNFILGLPSLLTNCVEVNERVCEFRPHLICSYLCSLVRVFSQYYRKVRILTEPRKHLLPVMFARIHLLKIINDTLKTCLRILNIKSVSQM